MKKRKQQNLLTTSLPVQVAAVGAVIVLLVLAWQQVYGADEYQLLIRGDVIEVDAKNKTVTVNSRHIGLGNAGENDLAGKSVEFNVSQAVFYKYDKNVKKVRATLGSFTNGDEVIVKGAKKAGGNFNASVITRNDNTVNLRGILQGHNVGDGTLEIDINKLIRASAGKLYRTNTFKVGDRITVYYDKDSTKFISRDGKEMNPDQVANNNEKITVHGIVVRFGSRFEAGPDAKVTDGRYKF